MMDITTSQPLNFQSTAFALLSYYSLESEHYPKSFTKGKVLGRWLKTYSEQWVCWALIESLYQGRYKAYSVEQILALWNRRGQPLYHFNPEFEIMICHDIPQRIEKAAVADRTVGDDSLRGIPAPIPKNEDSAVAAIPTLSESISDDFRSPVETEAEEIELAPAENSKRVDSQNDYWANVFKQPSMDTRESILSSVLNNDQLLPLTFGRNGLEPIHRFMPEAEPIEFCEKLAAIAAHQESASHQESARSQS
jgi:hypothetical protein